jgi:hypothetical protein
MAAADLSPEGPICPVGTVPVNRAVALDEATPLNISHLDLFLPTQSENRKNIFEPMRAFLHKSTLAAQKNYFKLPLPLYRTLTI